MSPIRVLIADDQSLVRRCVHSLLVSYRDVAVVGEAETVTETVQLAEQLHPHVVLMDFGMPGGGSLDAIRELRDQNLDLEVIVMADRLDAQEGLQAIEAGAAGYIVKDIPAAALVETLRSVRNGRAGFPSHPTPQDHLRKLVRHERARRRRETHGLTPRELQILGELSEGRTDSEIAERIHVTMGTMKTHIRNILRKMGCRNRTQAIALALRQGLIQ